MQSFYLENEKQKCFLFSQLLSSDFSSICLDYGHSQEPLENTVLPIMEAFFGRITASM